MELIRMEMNLKKGDGTLSASSLAVALLELAEKHDIALERDTFCDALWATAIPGECWRGVVPSLLHLLSSPWTLRPHPTPSLHPNPSGANVPSPPTQPPPPILPHSCLPLATSRPRATLFLPLPLEICGV